MREGETKPYYTDHRIKIKSQDGEYITKKVDPETVSEYTGLTDRNGKKVFEGDIVWRGVDIKFGYHRAYSESDPYEYGQAYGFYFEDGRKGANIDEDNVNEIVVIGNRWDNPELLKDCAE